MKKYQVTILSNEEFKKITGELPKFSDERFLVNQEECKELTNLLEAVIGKQQEV